MGAYPFFGGWLLMVSPLRRVTFEKSRSAGPAKSNQKALAPPLGTSPPARCARKQALLRGPPRRAVPAPSRLNRRPAGLPAPYYLFSASVVDGAPEINIKIKNRARRPESRPEWLDQRQIRVGAGLPAMQATRSFSGTESMPSQASQLPQKSSFACAVDLLSLCALDPLQPLRSATRPPCPQRLYPIQCGSWLACENIDCVSRVYRVARIAGKPAPTEKQLCCAVDLLSLCALDLLQPLRSATRPPCPQRLYPIQCGSWLACEGIDCVSRMNRVARIAGKPAPTEKQICLCCRSAFALRS